MIPSRDVLNLGMASANLRHFIRGNTMPHKRIEQIKSLARVSLATFSCWVIWLHKKSRDFFCILQSSTDEITMLTCKRVKEFFNSFTTYWVTQKLTRLCLVVSRTLGIATNVLSTLSFYTKMNVALLDGCWRFALIRQLFGIPVTSECLISLPRHDLRYGQSEWVIQQCSGRRWDEKSASLIGQALDIFGHFFTWDWTRISAN